MKKFILLLFLLFCIKSNYSQTVVLTQVSGFVVDYKINKLEGADVTLLETGQISYTNNNGEFIFDLKGYNINTNTQLKFLVRKKGYNSKTFTETISGVGRIILPFIINKENEKADTLKYNITTGDNSVVVTGNSNNVSYKNEMPEPTFKFINQTLNKKTTTIIEGISQVKIPNKKCPYDTLYLSEINFNLTTSILFDLYILTIDTILSDTLYRNNIIYDLTFPDSHGGFAELNIDYGKIPETNIWTEKMINPKSSDYIIYIYSIKPIRTFKDKIIFYYNKKYIALKIN